METTLLNIRLNLNGLGMGLYCTLSSKPGIEGSISVPEVGIHGRVGGFSRSSIGGGYQSAPVLLQLVWVGENNVVPISILLLVPQN